MRLALVALAAALPAASVAEAPLRSAQPALAPMCKPDLKVRPSRGCEAPRLRRLGELPPGDLTLAVLSRLGQCIGPVTVRHGYGILERGR